MLGATELEIRERLAADGLKGELVEGSFSFDVVVEFLACEWDGLFSGDCEGGGGLGGEVGDEVREFGDFREWFLILVDNGGFLFLNHMIKY